MAIELRNSKIAAIFKNRPRLSREGKTLLTMISMYCSSRHGSTDSCRECDALGDYAISRLDKCPFGEGKTVCSLCLVHCYKPEMRQKIREAMRYAGPRMMPRHPLMAINHILDKRRKNPMRAV